MAMSSVVSRVVIPSFAPLALSVAITVAESVGRSSAARSWIALKILA
nr:hypothetical protein [Corynebacterium sp. NML 120412]